LAASFSTAIMVVLMAKVLVRVKWTFRTASGLVWPRLLWLCVAE
jgi:hypothetical protein